LLLATQKRSLGEVEEGRKSLRTSRDHRSERVVSYGAESTLGWLQMVPLRKTAAGVVFREKPAISPGNASDSELALRRI
jgi:hypothetical protein